MHTDAKTFRLQHFYMKQGDLDIPNENRELSHKYIFRYYDACEIDAYADKIKMHCPISYRVKQVHSKL